MRNAAQQRAAAREQLTFGAVDDKISKWDDFATLSEAELAVLFAELTPDVNSIDRNGIKSTLSKEMDAAGAPADVIRQVLAGIDPLINQIEAMIGGAQQSYPTDMAREFKQIYAANCCGEAQFMQALGAAESKVANKLGKDLIARVSSQDGFPPGFGAMLASGITGGNAVITYAANDPAIQAARALVTNGGGGGAGAPPAPVATNTGGGTPPAPVATNTGGGGATPAPVATNTGGGTPPAPVATNTGGGTPPAPVATNTGGANALPTGGLLTPLPNAGTPFANNGPTGQLPGADIGGNSVAAPPVSGANIDGSQIGDARSVDILRDEIKALVGKVKSNPGSPGNLVAEIRVLNNDLQTLVNDANNSGIRAFWASDASGIILEYTEDGIDVAKVVVTVAACAGTGGTACAGILAVDKAFQGADFVSGAIGNAVDDYNEKVNGGDTGSIDTALGSIGSGVAEQTAEEFGKVIGGKLGPSIGRTGEIFKKVREELGKRVGKLFYSAGTSSAPPSGERSSYDASASLESRAAGTSFTSNSGQVIQR